MRFIATALGVIASLVMLGVSGAMNFLFMFELGKTETESLVLGAASASADGLKALLPFFIWWAWQDKRRFVAVAGSLVWCFFVGFSLLSAVGFSASNRGAVTDTREGLAATFETAARDLKDAEARRVALPEHRPSTIVQEALEGLKQNRRWSSSNGCSDATATASRAFCEEFFAARAELAAAVEGERLGDRIAKLKDEVKRLRDSGAGQDVDPQVSMLSKIAGHGEDRVRLLLIIVVAVLVELGSSLGLWLSTAHSEIFKRRKPMETETAMSSASAMPSTSASLVRGASRAEATPRRDAVANNAVLAIEGRKMGDVEGYCLARIDPAGEGQGVTLAALRKDYMAWCEAGGEEAFAEGDFADLIRAVAREIEVPEVKGRFVGITIRKGGMTRAA